MDALLGPPETGWVGGARDGGVETRFARGGRLAREQRDQLLPALHALQSGVGWISEGGLNYVCQRLTVPPAEAYGVATFYAMFSVEPRPRTVIHVCDDLACRLDGDALCVELERTAGPPNTAARPTPSPPGCGARASACANARRRSWSSGRRSGGRRVRSRDRDAGPEPPHRRHARRRSSRGRTTPRSRRRPRRGMPRPGPACGCSGASASWTPARSTTTGRTAGTRRCGAPTSSGPWARSARSPTPS